MTDQKPLELENVILNISMDIGSCSCVVLTLELHRFSISLNSLVLQMRYSIDTNDGIMIGISTTDVIFFCVLVVMLYCIIAVPYHFLVKFLFWVFYVEYSLV
jgi:hypothetical protein